MKKIMNLKVSLISAKRILAIRLKDLLNKSYYYGVSFALWDMLWWVCFYIRSPFSWKLSTLTIKRKTAWLDRYLHKQEKLPTSAH